MMNSAARYACMAIAIVLAAFGAPASVAAKTFTLASPAFQSGGTIPHHFSYRGYGCDGDNVSPALHWSGAPSSTRSYALTVFDPDAMKGKGWWHWIVFNIPVSASRLSENAGAASNNMLPKPAMQGTTGFQSAAWGGPCPPVGDPAHHYHFTLYALDVPRVAHATTSTTGPQLESLMRGHVLAKVQMLGFFSR